MSGMDPHYLHERTGIAAVVSPPVDLVTALGWHPRREELVVATRDGRLVSVDPVLGTRELAGDLPEAGVLAVSPDGEQVGDPESGWAPGSPRSAWRILSPTGRVRPAG